MSQQRHKEALIRGAIWALIGLLYAMLFVFSATFSVIRGLLIQPTITKSPIQWLSIVGNQDIFTASPSG
ncbi:MAG: hypothetical protein ABW150_03005 [Candidatus Thiodiazotropha sp.]